MNGHESAHLLFEEAMSYTYAAALRVAASLDVADHLAGGPRTPTELATAIGASADGLRRTLRLLAVRGIFHEDESGRFHLIDKGQALRSDAPVAARAGILMLTDRMFWTVTHRVTDALLDPDPGFEKSFGQPLDDYFERDPEVERLFYDGMERVSDAENDVVARACDLPAGCTVADVGGRFGGLLAAVLRRHPGVHGILFDRPEMVERHRLGGQGRVEVVAGDFYAEVPPADVYLLKRILHNLTDEDGVRLLTTCRRAMKPGGRVLVIDAILPPGDDPHVGKAMDFMMLAGLLGRERTVAELEPILTAAGLRIERVIPTSSAMSVVACGSLVPAEVGRP